jgi:hypothetical protein
LIVESYKASDFLNLTIFNDMPKSFTGGCECGAIRYEVDAEPIAMFNCHCRDCQRASGGPYTGVVYMPAKAVKITKGSPRYYTTLSEAMGVNKRGFCPDCGSRLFGGITDTGHGITLRVLMTRVFSNRSSKFGPPKRSLGTTWIRNRRSSSGIQLENSIDGWTFRMKMLDSNPVSDLPLVRAKF